MGPELPRERRIQPLWFVKKWILLDVTLIFILVLMGCANPTPILYPSPSSQNLPLQVSRALTILLTPVDTSGFASPAKAQYGLDVSAYFTAFELQLINQSDQPVKFESQEIYLVDAHGKRQQALAEEESVDYYRYGDLGPDGAVVLLSKPVTIMRAEIEQIRRLHVRSATLLPGETHRGIVLFKKIRPDQCHDIHVRIEGIIFTEVERSKDVDVAFNCENR